MGAANEVLVAGVADVDTTMGSADEVLVVGVVGVDATIHLPNASAATRRRGRRGGGGGEDGACAVRASNTTWLEVDVASGSARWHAR